jgi:hypothetical protein
MYQVGGEKERRRCKRCGTEVYHYDGWQCVWWVGAAFIIVFCVVIFAATGTSDCGCPYNPSVTCCC